MQTVLTNGKTSLPFEDVIRERLEKGNGNTLLFIVSTEQARLKRQRECLGHAPRRTIAGLKIYTFKHVVRRLSRYIDIRPTISRGLQMLWLREIVDGGQYPSLKSKAEIPPPKRTVAELLNAISQLKTNGIDASQMQSNSVNSAYHNPTAANEALSDFITIYENYNERLGDQLIDCADVHGAVANRLVEEENRNNQLMHGGFPDVDLVVAEGVDVSSLADLSILEGIARVPGLVMYVTFDWDAQNNALFGHVEQSYARFLELGFHQVDESGNRPSWNTTLTRHFSRNLFRKIRGVQSSVKKLNLTNRITLFRTRDRVKEVEAVAEVIKGRILNGCSSALHRICLTYYNLERYASLIHEIFPIYGIPYTLDEESRLSISPFSAALFSLLDEIEDSVAAPSEDAFQSPYFTVENPALLIADCEFDAEMSPGEFKRSVARLVQISRVRQQILDREGTALHEDHPFTIEREISAFDSVQSLIAELVEFLISRHGDEQSHSLRSYIDWLRFMASQTTYHLKPQTDSGVSVLSLAQTRGLDFDIVILGGLIDGEFPATFRPDAFLPPNLRRKASDLLREQRFLFYQALNLFREHLYLVVPEHDDKMNLIQSPFIDELGHIADFTTEQAKSGVLFSPEHFLRHYGKYVWAQLEEGDCSSTPVPLQFSNLASTARRALPAVEHSVHVEKSRGITHRLPQYTGQLSSQLLSGSSWEALSNFRSRSYSISKLESYGQCPFQFLSKYVLRLKHEHEEEENEDGLTTLGKGRRLHEILSEFYVQRYDKPPIAQCTDAEFEVALQELTRIAKNVLDVYAPDNLFWEVEMEAIIGGKGKHGILPRFLDQERERELEVEPRYFEVGFGHGNSSIAGDRILSSREPVKVGGVNLSGKIDRVEIGDRIFTIGDYTTGAGVPKIRAIREGRSLQLPIYLAVVEQLLSELTFEDIQPVGGIYYILRENGKAELGIGNREYNEIAFKAHPNNHQLLPTNSNSKRHPLSPDFDYEGETIRSVIDRSVLYVSEYVSSISNGQFPLTPHDPKDVCRYCGFKRICRIGAITEDDADR